MKSDVPVFDVAYLMAENVLEIKTRAHIITKFAHHHGGVVGVQVLDRSPFNEVAHPPCFLHTLNFSVVK